MSEFPDRRSFVGRVGALTVIGDLAPLGGKLSSRSFEFMKLAWKDLQYRDLANLAELYALRWSVVRFPDSAHDSLIFETVFHGDWEQYLLKLIRKTAVGIDMHALSIKHYPGTADLDIFLAFLLRHHHPAAHVWAAHPVMSPIDIDQFQPPDEAHDALEQVDARWFGVLVPLRPDASGSVRDLLSQWNVNNSPLRVSTIQHGRVVLVERGQHTYLLLSIVYTSKRCRFRKLMYWRGNTDRADREIVKSLVGQFGNQWHQLLSHGVDAVPTHDDLVESLMRQRYGHRKHGSIRWVDWCWHFSPDLQRPFWEGDRARPTMRPSETSRRTPVAPG